MASNSYDRDKRIKDGRFTPEEIDKRIQRLKSERGTWESHWQEISEYIHPNRNTITRKDVTEGEKKLDHLLDNTGIQSNELLTGAVNSMLIPTNGDFFTMTTGDAKLDAEDDVRQWVQETVRSMHNVLVNSNFFTENHEKDLDQTAFGTGCMLMEEDDTDVVRFSTKFIADYYIDEDSSGRVDQIYEERSWTVEKIVDFFGEKNLSKDIAKDWEKGEYAKKYTIQAAIYPRKLTDKGGRKFVLQYVCKECKHEFKHGGYDTFPYMTPRWSKAAGEKYGRGPGSVALPECRVLNKMNETMLIGAQRFVDPPVQLPDDGFILPIATQPGGINYRRSGNPDDQIKPIFNDTRLDFGYQALEDRRKRIRDAFYVEQLRLQQGGPMMTATEVMQRTEEQMRLLGPILGRQQSEFLKPMIDRLFDIMWRRKLLKPPPQVLAGRTMGVRYSSFMAKAQRAAEGQSIQRFWQDMVPFIQVNPQSADLIATDEAPRLLASIHNVPQELIRNKRDVEELRAARAQQEQQAAEMAQATQAAQVGASVTQAAGAVGATE